MLWLYMTKQDVNSSTTTTQTTINWPSLHHCWLRRRPLRVHRLEGPMPYRSHSTHLKERNNIRIKPMDLQRVLKDEFNKINVSNLAINYLFMHQFKPQLQKRHNVHIKHPQTARAASSKVSQSSTITLLNIAFSSLVILTKWLIWSITKEV